MGVRCLIKIGCKSLTQIYSRSFGHPDYSVPSDRADLSPSWLVDTSLNTISFQELSYAIFRDMERRPDPEHI